MKVHEHLQISNIIQTFIAFHACLLFLIFETLKSIITFCRVLMWKICNFSGEKTFKKYVSMITIKKVNAVKKLDFSFSLQKLYLRMKVIQYLRNPFYFKSSKSK